MPAKTRSVVAEKTTPYALPDLPRDLHARLREDIARRGVLVPVIRCAQTNDLLDGRVRTEIAKELGLPCPTIFLGKLTAHDRGEIRDGLNAFRRHLTRAQLQAILDGEVRASPGESDRRIAGRVGCDHKAVGRARARTGGAEPHLDRRIGRDGKAYPSRSPAVFTSNMGQRESIRRNMIALGDDSPDQDLTPRKLRRLVGRKERAALLAGQVELPSKFTVKCCDFRENGIESGSVDLAYVDPDWGDPWKKNRLDFARENFRILRPGGVACCYFGHQQMLEFADLLRSVGFVYRWTIAMVNVEENVGSCSYFGSMLSMWRPVLIFQKGGPGLRTAKMLGDVFRTEDRDKSMHRWAQSVGEAVHLIAGLTKNGSTIADLTCCTGTSGVASAIVGSPIYHGVEIEEDLCRLARSRIAGALRK